jgi:hypothetical protein
MLVRYLADNHFAYPPDALPFCEAADWDSFSRSTIHAAAWVVHYASVTCAGQNERLFCIGKIGAIKRHNSVANNSRWSFLAAAFVQTTVMAIDRRNFQTIYRANPFMPDVLVSA